jgi:hypothetical protein
MFWRLVTRTSAPSPAPRRCTRSSARTPPIRPTSVPYSWPTARLSSSRSRRAYPRRPPPGRHGHGEVAPAQHGRHGEVTGGRIVDGVEQHALPLRLSVDTGLLGGVAGGGHGQEGAGQVAVFGGTGDNGHRRPGFDQRVRSPPGHRPGAEDDAAPAGHLLPHRGQNASPSSTGGPSPPRT